MTKKGRAISSVLINTPERGDYLAAKETAKNLRRVLNAAGVKIVDSLKESPDLAIAVGGDGTMMHTVSELAGTDMPTLGVNAGDVGFLSSADASDWERVVTRVISGDFDIEERLGLSLTLRGKEIKPVVNEVVFKHESSVATFSLSIGGQQFYESLMGDGVMVSTATGSTGYNTSAGGPILLPGSGNVVVTPLNPMVLCTRSIVSQELMEGKDITVTLTSSKRNENVLLIADGKLGEYSVGVGDTVTIKKYEKPLLFATFGLRQYARALNEKKGFAQ